MRGATRRAGFTLIELLLALTLIGMMTLALFGGLRFGARAWESGSERMARMQTGDATIRLLRQIVAGAAPVLILPGGRTASSIEGGPKSLKVAAPWPRPVGTGGLHLFTLAPDPATGELILEWGLARQAAEGLGRHRRALPGAARVSLRYYGQRPRETGPAWAPEWRGAEGPPQLVEIRLVGAGGETGPATVVAVEAARASP